MTWQTNEAATSQVEYWKTEGDHETTPLEDNLKQSHTVRLTGLTPNTTYHFTAKSADASGNEATSNTKTLATLRAIPDGHEVGKRAPEFALLEYNDVNNRESPNKGDTVDLGKFLGNRKILLDFWSTGCSACLAQFPLIREIYYGHKCKQNADNADIAVFTVCIDGERTDRIQKLIDKYSDPEKFGPFDFPILLDKEGMTTTDVYNIWRIPKTVFIDSDGIIREIKIGRFHSKEEIESILDSL